MQPFTNVPDLAPSESSKDRQRRPSMQLSYAVGPMDEEPRHELPRPPSPKPPRSPTLKPKSPLLKPTSVKQNVRPLAQHPASNQQPTTQLPTTQPTHQSTHQSTHQATQHLLPSFLRINWQLSHLVMFCLGAGVSRFPLFSLLFLAGGCVAVYVWLNTQQTAQVPPAKRRKSLDRPTSTSPRLHASPVISPNASPRTTRPAPASPTTRAFDHSPLDPVTLDRVAKERQRMASTPSVDESHAFRPYNHNPARTPHSHR